MKTNDVSKIAESPDLSPVQPVHETLPELAKDCRGQAPYKRMRLQFVAAVACQLLILTGLASVKAYTLYTGTTVTLRTLPVDPRDMFRGDYVRLNYEISTVPTKQEFSPGDEVYVVLNKGEPDWKPVAVAAKSEQVPPSAVAIKGKVEWQECAGKKGSPRNLHLHYGIEQAFVPEGSGHALENQKHLIVQVAVDRFGNSIVKKVNSR